jgi:HAMP domain-containing protein
MRLSVKVGAICAAAAITPVILVSALASSRFSSEWREAAMRNSQSNARSAAAIYEKRLAQMRSAAQALALEIAYKAALAGDGSDANAALASLQNLLPPAQNEFGLDFIIVTNPAGRVILRHNDRPTEGETLTAPSDKNPVAEHVISDAWQQRHSPAASLVVERGERLVKLGLDRRAQVESSSGIITDGLMIEAGAPILTSGRFVGMVLIGQMLNNSYGARPGASSLQTPLEIEARQTIFGGAGDLTGAAIALGDAIIASSVPAGEAARESQSKFALMGVRCDPSRQDEVIRQSELSYAIFWQPLKSLDGAPTASIGIVVPASEIVGPSGEISTTIIIVGLVAMVLAGAAGFLYGRSLGARLEALSEAADRMGLGELSSTIDDSAASSPVWLPPAIARDEVSRLAEQMDQMRESFRQAVERLRKR